MNDCTACRFWQPYTSIGYDWQGKHYVTEHAMGCEFCKTPAICGRYERDELLALPAQKEEK